MAHVLALSGDANVRNVLDYFLCGEGHIVRSMSEDDQALAVLRTSRHAIVVILHPPLATLDIFDLLRRVADDTSGRLARHRYIVAAADPQSLQPAQQNLVDRVAAQMVVLPYDLEDMAEAVECAEEELETVAPAELQPSHPATRG